MKADPAIIPKGFQFAVLRAVPVLGADACGTEILEYLQRASGTEIPSAQVYVALKRLERHGVIEDAPSQDRPAGRRGHPRRVFRLTMSGQQSLEAGMRLFGIPSESRGLDEEQRGATSPLPA